MTLPSRRTRVVLLAGVATLAAAAPAAAAPVPTLNGTELTVDYGGADAVTLASAGAGMTLNGVAIPGVTQADLTAIKVIEAAGGGANTIDLSGVLKDANDPTVPTVSVEAGDGNDTIKGSFYNDVLSGGAGDDRIDGFRGDDTMNGQSGSDTLVWNNGDGSDVMNAGEGSDTIENNGADAGPAANETYTVEPNGARFEFKRISTGPFSLDVGDAEKYVNNMLGGDDTFRTADPAVAVTGIAVTLNGGAGNDGLIGTNGNDVLNGDAGNDVLVGFRGNDDHNGGDGDDQMVWNNGDGSDTMDGDAGNDTAVDNGAPAGDHFIVSANGARVTATRDNLVPFFLDIGSTEALDMNSLGGDDSVDVGAGLQALIKADIDLGEGNDSIRARNTSSEKIEGGAGTDSAVVDATDVTTGVETLDAPDTAAPGPDLLTKSATVRRGKVKLRVACPGEVSCTGTLQIRRGGKVVGKTKLALAGKTKRYTVKLNRRTRRALRNDANGRMSVRVRIKVTDAAGNAATVNEKLTLKRR